MLIWLIFQDMESPRDVTKAAESTRSEQSYNNNNNSSGKMSATANNNNNNNNNNDFTNGDKKEVNLLIFSRCQQFA